MADSISDSLNSKINNTDFLNLVKDCQNSLQHLDDYINVLHPLMAKEIKLAKNQSDFSFDGVCPFCGLPMNTSMTTTVTYNTGAKSVEIPSPLRPQYLMKHEFTILTVTVSLQNATIAKAMLSL